jgi:hypothetical protein
VRQPPFPSSYPIPTDILLSETPPKITLKLPVEKEEKEANGKAKDKKGKDKDKDSKKRPLLDVHGIPNEYEVSLPSHVVKNTYVFTEHERTWVAQPGEEGSAARRKRQKGECRVWG